jgi:hypothetical protein
MDLRSELSGEKMLFALANRMALLEELWRLEGSTQEDVLHVKGLNFPTIGFGRYEPYDF